MHAVLIPFGSAGDVFPFLWLGRQLKARGHQVTMIVSAPFEPIAKQAGLTAIPIGTEEEFNQVMADPRIWKLYHGTKFVFEFAGESTALLFGVIQSLIEKGQRPDLLLAPCTVFGARLAREKYGIPLVTVDVQPAVFISAYEPPILIAGMQHLRKLPLALRQWLIRLPNPADRFSAPGVRKACAQQNITPPKSVWWDWGHSPDGVLALFPKWLAAPQPDWPENLLQWDFPLEDIAQERPLSEEVLSFLKRGPKPIVFTPGSANIQAEHFFKVAHQAVTDLGQRAIFVTRKLGQLPPSLPDTILAVEYAPFSALVPHAAAFVHHGGIGTLSQGFAAGVPQLIMAMAHDQPDNAYRLEQLGAGIGLTPRTFTPSKVKAVLDRLLHDPSYTQASLDCQKRMQQRLPVEALMQWLENRRCQIQN